MRPAILGLSLTTRRGNGNNTTSENTNTLTTTPKTPRPQRVPLQARDQNANMKGQHKGAPLSSRNGNNAKMPSYDKINNNGAGTRPLMPTLSSAAAKTVNKTPLTPRVAGPTHSQTSTPASRRVARQDGGLTPGGSQNLAEISTPVSTFLNHNITPRSSTRKGRVDGTNDTPVTTPNGTPAPEVREFEESPLHGVGLGIGGTDFTSPRLSTITFSPTPSDVGSNRREQAGDDNKFFYASDAKISGQQPRQQRPLLPSKTSSFFYANGESIPPPINSGASAVGSVTGSSMGDERTQPKFFHANATPDLRPKSTHNFPTTASTISSAPHNTAPRLGALSPQQRPISPTKNDRLSSFPALKATARSSPAPPRPNAAGRGQSAQEISHTTRVSTDSSRRSSGHEKSISTGSVDLNSKIHRISITSPILPSSPSSPSQPITTSLTQSPEPIISDNENGGSLPHSGLQSPIKSGHSLEHMNELAANARRERKVLDLEITNSSLAAINRTLEREMRKQTAELRRYRRLSRSGRLSIATTTSMRSSSGGLSLIDEDGNQLSDMSEESEEEDEDEDISEDDSLDDASLSPSAIAESDARHRKKDEKRLQLDLSKHQQLLVDSQKMNQSLKRCLGWTEELINEGKKALEYNVRVSDVEIGGRVLAPDDVEEAEENEGLSDIGVRILSEARAHAAAGGGWGVEGLDGRNTFLKLDTMRDATTDESLWPKLQDMPP